MSKPAADFGLLTPQDEETLDVLLTRLEIPNVDMVMIGDGSGSGWDHEAGWATVTIEKATKERRVWCGSVNIGSVNFAEIMAYIQPLCWIVNREIERKANGMPRRLYTVAILTDSEYVANTLNDKIDKTKGKNSILWQQFDCLKRQGILIQAKWVRRDTYDLNRYVDTLSKAARLMIKARNLVAEIGLNEQGEHMYTQYDFNPD
jgi:ribonuclease HI